jgi:hypothetical protein
MNTVNNKEVVVGIAFNEGDSLPSPLNPLLGFRAFEQMARQPTLSEKSHHLLQLGFIACLDQSPRFRNEVQIGRQGNAGKRPERQAAQKALGHTRVLKQTRVFYSNRRRIFFLGNFTFCFHHISQQLLKIF